MYYFDVLEVFEKHPKEQMTFLEVVIELKKRREVAEKNIQRALTKLYLSGKLDREYNYKKYGKNGGREYVYWLIIKKAR